MSLTCRSHGLWHHTAPPPPLTPVLEEEITADVIVIGAGYTGLSSALHLAEAGVEVVVLEAAETGFGGSGRNVGLVNAGMWVMPDDVLKVLGGGHGQRLLSDLGEAPALVFDLIARHGIDCEAERQGTLHCAVGAAGLAEIRSRAEQWRKRGADVHLLGPAETAAKIGSDIYAGSLLDRRAGTIQPLAYARGLAQAALTAGARLYCQSAVLGADQAGARWRVRTAKGAVTAEWVIVAGNAYVQGPWSQARAELVLLPYFNLATQPLPEAFLDEILPGREGAWDTKAVLSSFRLDQDGRLIFGSVGALRLGGERVHANWAKRSIARLFPQLPALEFEHGWYGQIGMTKDNVPRFHQFDRNVVGFCGYNGRGIGTGTAFGRALTCLVLGRCTQDELPLPVTKPSPRAFAKVAGGFYEAGAQIAHGIGSRL